MNIVMEDQQHIDKLFRESLNQRSFDIPEAFLEDLNKRLDEGEKKRRVFFWWFITLFCLTGLPVIIFLALQFPAFKLRNFEQLSPSDEFAQSRFYNPANSKTLENTGPFQVPVHQQAIFGMIQPKTETFAGKTKVPILSKTTPDKLPVSVSNPANVQKAGRKKQFVRTKQDISFKTYSESIPDTLNEVFPDSFATLSRKEIDFDTLRSGIGSIDQTDKESFASGLQTDALNKKNSPEYAWRKEIQLFGGLGANFIHDSHSDKTYLGKIAQNQSSILAPSFGIRGNLSYKKFTFGTGLSYSQTGEKYAAEMTKYIIKDSTYSEHVIDTILVFDDSLGIWVPEIHDTTLYHTYQYQDSTLERKSFKNNYSWISIPLYFGYRFQLGNYELIPRIGAQFNFGIAKNKGKFPNGDFNGMIEYQAVRFTISYLVQLEARRNFGKWHVFINPYFKSMINPAISGELIRRRYSSWGIQFGVGLKL